MKTINFKAFLILVISVFTISCNKNEFVHVISNAIEKECSEKNECRIDLKETFSFEWDTLYLFTSYDDPMYISSTIGLDCGCKIVPEYKRLAVFLKNKVIVKKEYFDFDKLSFVKEGGNQITPIIIDIDHAIVKVSRIVTSKKSYTLEVQAE